MDDEDKSALELYESARDFIRQKKFNEALVYLEQSLEIEKTHLAYHDKGVIYYLARDFDNAITALVAATRIDPNYAPAYANLARIMNEKGQLVAALEYAMSAMRADPDNVHYKDDFVQLLRDIRFRGFLPALKPYLLKCLQDDNVDHEALACAWHSQIQKDPAFKALGKLAGQKNYKKFEKVFRKLKSKEFLNDEYMIWGLKRLVVKDLGFEKLLTRLRRAVLLNGGESLLPFLAALGEYCFQTEYIFAIENEEQEQVNILGKEAQGGDAALWQIALLSCYMPLGKTGFKITGSEDELADLIVRQVEDLRVEQEFKNNLPVLTALTDGTTKAVQDQYESFPYPRWKTIGLNYKPRLQFEGKLREILVAGCGTGKEALAMARSFPDCNVLAVDISRASLSYAARMAQELGIGNVSFGQADILELGGIGRIFDIVTATGVLHHMKDPEEGLAALVPLVRPGGYVHIGLYSQLARQHVNKARDYIGQAGYNNDALDIRRFRKEGIGELDENTQAGLMASADFYLLSNCRDLLFHVQEHQFSLHQVSLLLDKFNLDPLHLPLPKQREKTYQLEHPDDPAMNNISYLTVFEENYPDTFRGMYNIWCQKVLSS